MKHIVEDKMEMTDSEIQLAIFTVGGDNYAMDIMKIKEIIKPLKITPLPNVPDFIEGVINLRGALIPVISMRERFGFVPDEGHKNARIIIMAMRKIIVGIIVDSVEEIISVPLKDVQPPPKIAKGIDSEYLKGICRMGDEALVLLDLEKILTTTEQVIMEEMEVNVSKADLER